jgi:serine-type D-Ala-D-Ala carboxypeptidase/endopeptidase
MKKIANLFFWISLLTSTFNSFGQVNKDSLDALVMKLGQDLMKEKETIGLSIGVLNYGKPYFYNFGTTEKGKQITPTENTGYQIGSITKTFMSLLLANAVEEKKVNLNDDIRKFIGGKYPNLEYAGQPVKIIHLANTSSSLPDWLIPTPEYIQKSPLDSTTYLKDSFFRKINKEDFFSALHNVKLDTIPGSKAKHSNTAAILLGYILETVNNKTIEQLLEEYIVKSYDLKGTLFLTPTTNTSNIAKGYNGKGELMPYEPPIFNTAGGLISTSSDLLKYAKVLLENQSKTTQLVLKRNIEVDMQTNKTKKINPKSRFKPSAYCVSLNWFSYKFDSGNTQIWADGGATGFNSYLVFIPKLNSAIVILANASDEKIFRTLPNMTYQLMDLLGHK